LNNLFGPELETKLRDQRVLMVGCGALGCEWLKNLSLMNVSTGTGIIQVTDPDHIEHSNLSRQFLFRPNNVGMSKSKVAIDSIMKTNPRMNMVAFENKVTPKDKEFTRQIFRNKDIVINALDNIEARRYVDEQCFNNSLPLFESGTMGMKGNTQPVVPFVTETYSNSSDPVEEKQFAICTIKNFPNQILHTIHWARDYFELFNRAPSNINKFMKDRTYVDPVKSKLPQIERIQAIEDLNIFLGKYNPIDWKHCVNWARDIFEKEFNHNIKQLLHMFPKDHIVSVGNKSGLFWSHGKRCPTPLTFDENDNCIVDFIEATTHILCRCFNVPELFSKSNIISEIRTFTITNFTPGNMHIAKTDSEIKEKVLTDVELKSNVKNIKKYCVPQEFEKDDDTNWHVAWLTAASNCRALNYDIPPSTKYETKGIAGRIIPAVATTTATIVGFISLEFMKYVAGIDNIESYRSWFVNMADNTSIGAEPIKAPELNIGNAKINSWKKFQYNKDSSLKEFMKYFQDLFKTEISMILYNTSIIYADFMPDCVDTNINLVELFKNSYDLDLTKNKLNLILTSDDDEIELPSIVLDLQ